MSGGAWTARPVWFLYHVPKTGGQTLRRHLDRVLDMTRHVHLGRREPELPKVTAEAAFAGGTTAIDVVTGHELARSHAEHFPDRPVREVLILRDPLERMLSHWNYSTEARRRQGRGPRPWDRFAATHGPDPMTRLVAGMMGESRPEHRLDAALYGLESIEVVGTLDRLDEIAPLLLAEMGLPATVPARANRSGVEIPRLTPPSVEVQQEWIRSNRQDAILFEAARQRTEPSIARLRARSSD